MPYVELHACSAFSFLRGGSFPEQLAETAAALAMPAMALLDRNGVYGAQRFAVTAREHGVRPIVGAELTMEDGSVLPVLVKDRIGYENLCELLTQAHLRTAKGECAVQWNELAPFAKGLVLLFGRQQLDGFKPSNWSGAARGPQANHARHLIDVFDRANVCVEIQRHFVRGEDRVNEQLC
ncbi:MAG: error-prone polymerase, partial [Verrucomicrobiota bacterium]